MVMLLASGAVARTTKVEICHIPPDDPSAAHTISVSAKAAAAHQSNHGDFLGACECELNQDCDDGDLCTDDLCVAGQCVSSSGCAGGEACNAETGECVALYPCLALLPDGWEPDNSSSSADEGICPDGSTSSGSGDSVIDTSTRIALRVSESHNVNCTGTDVYRCSVTGQGGFALTFEQYLACRDAL